MIARNTYEDFDHLYVNSAGVEVVPPIFKSHEQILQEVVEIDVIAA